MTEFLRTPKSVILPTLGNIKDEELRKVLEEYNKAFNELVIAVYSDLAWLHQRIYTLEHP
jgi:hypothetical protein